MTQRNAVASGFLSSGYVRQRLFGIPTKEASFAYRGFRGGAAQARHNLERVGMTFLRGYHTALAAPESEDLVPRLNAIDPEVRGFAFEGAAMSLALLDMMTPWKRDRWSSFLKKGAEAHVYLVHVGVGWAVARLQRWFKLHPGPADPLLRWLVVDGYGFHEGYFHWERFVKNQAAPTRLAGYATKVFDQGLGRSIWFVDGADVERIPMTIGAFPESRRADLWSGIGLACAYAGGVDRAAIQFLQNAAAPYKPQLAQGAAFAAKARQRAGNPVSHTETACDVLCHLSSQAAAEITDRALENLPGGDETSYECWRTRIQISFA